MSEIPEQLRSVITQRFEKDLVEKVRMLIFTQEMECIFCEETRKLVEAVASWSEKISVDRYDFVKNAKEAEELQITKIPGLVILGKKDFGIRFFGAPTGYEFETLIEWIVLASSGKSTVPPAALTELDKIATNPATIQIFVIPTCPICPVVATMAMQLAAHNENINVHIVEIAEYPHLATRYNVVGTPTVVINETIRFEGAVTLSQFIHYIQKAIQGSPTGISSTI